MTVPEMVSRNSFSSGFALSSEGLSLSALFPPFADLLVGPPIETFCLLSLIFEMAFARGRYALAFS